MVDLAQRIDSENKLDRLLEGAKKTPRDLTLVIFASLAFALELITLSLPISIWLLWWLLAVGLIIILFFPLKQIAVSILVKLRLRYYNLDGMVVYVRGANQEEHWQGQRICLKLLKPKQVLLEEEIKGGLGFRNKKDLRDLRRTNPREVEMAEESIKCAKSGELQSYYTETSDHKYRMLFVSYGDITEPSSRIRIKTRLGGVQITGVSPTLYYFGNYKIYTLPSDASDENQLMVFIFEKLGFPSFSKKEPTAPKAFGAYFMVQNYNYVKMKEIRRQLEEKVRWLVAKLEREKEVNEAKQAAQKSRSELERHLSRITELTRESMISKVETWPQELVVRQRSEMRQVTRRDRIAEFVKQLTVELIIGIIIAVLLIVAPIILGALGIHS